MWGHPACGNPKYQGRDCYRSTNALKSLPVH